MTNNKVTTFHISIEGFLQKQTRDFENQINHYMKAFGKKCLINWSVGNDFRYHRLYSELEAENKRLREAGEALYKLLKHAIEENNTEYWEDATKACLDWEVCGDE